jgi:Protein of unknown function (DUF1236)
MTYFRHGASVLALLVAASAASAQTTVITREPVQTQTIVTERPALVLTPQQRQIVYRDIARERVAPAPGTVTYTVGARLPAETRLYTVPDTVAVEVPAVKQYRYMMVNGRVVLVDPVSSEVVAELSE